MGRPNVGKSTLLNRFLGQKIAIVSPKPETTRSQLLGILTLPNAQLLFLDTPGIYKGAKTLLAKHQVRAAREALVQADALLLVTEAHVGLLDEDRHIVRMMPKEGTVPVFLAINKVDRIEKKRILPQIDQARRLYPFRDIVPICAKKGDNVEPLLQELLEALPVHPPVYPSDQITDRSVRLLAQELIREKTLIFTHEEIPHAVAVFIEEWRAGASKEGADRQSSIPPEETDSAQPLIAPSSPRPTYIRATIYLERESQKGILIGKGGGLLKKIGQEARREIEDLIEGPAFLDLWVKVARGWRKDPAKLKEFGY